MNIELTNEFLYINSDFLGLFLELPLYLLAGSVGIWYAVRLLRRDRDHIG
jgi:hypothetical protein